MTCDRITDVGTGVDTSVCRISTVYNISNILAIRVESAIVDRIPVKQYRRKVKQRASGDFFASCQFMGDRRTIARRTGFNVKKRKPIMERAKRTELGKKNFITQEGSCYASRSSPPPRGKWQRLTLLAILRGRRISAMGSGFVLGFTVLPVFQYLFVLNRFAGTLI